MIEIFTNSLGMQFKWIPLGCFMMGSPKSEKVRCNDEVPHRVTLSRDYYMGVYEVTVDNFHRFVDSKDYRTTAECEGFAYGINQNGKWEAIKGLTWLNPGFAQDHNHPVVCISWNDCEAYVNWLNEQYREELERELGAGWCYRLPSEAEWEYACRAGTTTPYSFGNDGELLAQYGNVADASAKRQFSKWTTISGDDGYVYTSPVGSYEPNGYGLYDMHGNVWEWCSDWYGAYPHGSVTDPSGVSHGSYRVSRGGGWNNDAAHCRSASRYYGTPANKISCLGVRLSISSQSK